MIVLFLTMTFVYKDSFYFITVTFSFYIDFKPWYSLVSFDSSMCPLRVEINKMYELLDYVCLDG